MLFIFVRLFLKSGGVLIFFQSPSGASHGLNTNFEDLPGPIFPRQTQYVNFLKVEGALCNL